MLFCLSLLVSSAAPATQFAAAITPPRFELNGKPGDVLRNSVRITNLGNVPGEFLVRTADWSLKDDGSVAVHGEKLQPGSCRPWTRIERHQVRLAAQGEQSYRFEVHIPNDAQSGECRFAILFQQPPESADAMAVGDLNVPVLGQIALIVYVTVGDAAPKLGLEGVRRIIRNGQTVPALTVVNSGRAHGRPQGLLRGTDAKGNKVNLVVAPSPVLPGETRDVTLWPVDQSNDPVKNLSFPVTVNGDVEWPGGKFSVDTVVQ